MTIDASKVFESESERERERMCDVNVMCERERDLN
jgi:hypothetical protein